MKVSFFSSKNLFYLLLLLLPLNLGKHFILGFSYVNGVLVDYLVPTVYLTDVILVLMITTWLVEKFRLQVLGIRNKEPGITNYKLRRISVSILLLLLFIVFSGLSIFNALNKVAAIYRFVRLLEYAVFYFYIVKNIDLKEEWQKIVRVLTIGALFQSILVISQWFKQSSMFGYWFFGESVFNASTPGIARIGVFGELKVRPYGTFPHPNALGGYLAIVLTMFLGSRHLITNYQLPYPLRKRIIAGTAITKKIFVSIQELRNFCQKCFSYAILCFLENLTKVRNLVKNIKLCVSPIFNRFSIIKQLFNFFSPIFKKDKIKFFISYFTLYSLLLALFLTFSRSAIIVGFLGIILFLILNITNQRPQKINYLLLITYYLFFVFLCFCVFVFLCLKPNFDDLSFVRRTELINTAIKMIKTHPWIGVGLNNFTVVMQDYGTVSGLVRFLQPVHNVYLLITSETGILNLVVFLLFVISGSWRSGIFKKQSTISNQQLGIDYVRGNILLIALAQVSALMFFDHYFWTLQQTSLLLWLIIGLVGKSD